MTALPNCLVVGAGKTGTTWLHTCLGEHPEVYVSGYGEVDFFSTQYDRGYAWYRDLFQGAEGSKATIDVSPSYLAHPEAPERIHAWNPDVRLIFSFRNPVERAYSLYCMKLRAAMVSEDVERELRLDSRFVHHGFYFQHLRRYLDFFDREQILCLLYDDLKQDPVLYLKQVYSFLGVDSSFEPSLLHRAYHARKPHPRYAGLLNTSRRAYDWVRKSARLTPLVTLVEHLRREGHVDVLHRLNRGDPFPPLPAATARRLAETYEHDLSRLAKWLGRDLSSWTERYLSAPL